MTIIYDPHHPKYTDEKDVRDEMTRVFDLCYGCRLCFKFCTSFPTLFDMIDQHEDQDAGWLTPAQQDQVVSECFQCKLCYVNCPYIPGLSEWELDFPRLMLRVDAMRHQNNQVSLRDRMTNEFMGHTDLIGTVSSIAATVLNKAIGAKPGSVIRKAIELTTGVSSVRLLPPYAKQRFSTWFRKRARIRLERRQGRVTLFPTCLIEYQEPQIGHDLVKVYERNGIECNLADTGCCGAPWLHAGDVEQFTKIAAKNVKTLANEVRRGNDIVVPQPTCGYILKKDYPDYLANDDARLVAAHTFDSSEYLMRFHREDGKQLNTEFNGPVPETVTYHVPCHLRAQNIGFKSRDLMKLTGAKVKLVQQCSGIDGMWGLRGENADLSIPISKKLADELERAGGDLVTGDCHLANTAITEQTGTKPLHPLQMLARAYGIAEEQR